MNTLSDAILLVLLGGIFGWLLGRMPDKWVYAIMAVAVLLAVLVMSGTLG